MSKLLLDERVGQAIDRRRVWIVVDEVREQLRRDEARRGRVADQDGQDVVGVEVAGLALEGLGAGVVLGLVEGVVQVLVERVAGEGARRFVDVLLGVVADADGEQLLHFAGVVLVRRALAVQAVVEPDQHGRVARDLLQQRLEVAEAVVAEQLDLLQHQHGVADFAVGRGEVVVPEEGHLLLERPLRVQHAVEPPELGGFDLFGIAEVGRQRRQQLVGGRIVHLLGVEESVEGAGEAQRGVLVELGFGCAEAGSAQKVRYLGTSVVKGHVGVRCS